VLVRDGAVVAGHREEPRLQDPTRPGTVEQAILPHLDAAYNLARWLTATDEDAEDVLQEACLRAVKFFPGFQGGSARAWLLMIVRRTCYTWLAKNRAHTTATTSFDEELHSGTSDDRDPQMLLLREADRQLVQQALEKLPVELREMLILRELEGLSYKEAAAVAEIPVGTVMSRLSRGRQQLEQLLAARLGGEVKDGL
jgi:RNA polymerase sigma factor (sigma-70 family)